MYSHSIYELSKSIDSYRAEIFFQTKFISIRVWCASSIHHCLPPTLSKQSSMKNWRNQRVRVLHYPQVLTACYELKFFPSLRVFSYDANKHWKQRNHPNPTCRYLLFVFFLHGEVRSQHIFILFKERQIKINPQHTTYENGIISKQKKFQHVK